MHSRDFLRETAEGYRNGIKFYLLERDPVFWRRLVQQVVRAKEAKVEWLVFYSAALSGRVWCFAHWGYTLVSKLLPRRPKRSGKIVDISDATRAHDLI
jgi:hypothetical protein